MARKLKVSLMRLVKDAYEAGYAAGRVDGLKKAEKIADKVFKSNR